MPIPSISNEAFTAFITHNRQHGIHRKGYNGVAALIPHGYGNNLFVPAYAGLNYETISLSGLSPYVETHKTKFEPRAEPMSITEATDTQVVLEQPETSHARVSARITFSAHDPHYLHQKIELTFHRRFCSEDEPNIFSSLWASYIHQPRDRYIYLQRPDAKGPLDRWVGLTREDHGSPEYDVRHLPDQEIAAADHLSRMNTSEPVDANHRQKIEDEVRSGLSHYYGICGEDLVFLMMFGQPDRIRLAYSPNDGGKSPEWSPAWDYILHLDDVEVGPTYRWDVGLAVFAYDGRAGILDEVTRFREGETAG